MKLSCACCADLRESTDKLQRDLNQAVDQAAFKTSKTEFQVDKVSQSAADSVADVIESVKSEPMTAVRVPPFLSVEECWRPSALLWVLAVLVFCASSAASAA